MADLNRSRQGRKKRSTVSKRGFGRVFKRGSITKALSAKRTLFVPPCRMSFRENVEFRLYYCPSGRKLRDARYLGIYKDKCVQAIGVIAKVVSCDVKPKKGTVTVLDRTAALTPDEKKRILYATKRAKAHNWALRGRHKFVLCDSMEETAFRKTTKGGLRSLRYFDLEEVLGASIPSDLKALAERLRSCDWESQKPRVRKVSRLRRARS